VVCDDKLNDIFPEHRSPSEPDIDELRKAAQTLNFAGLI